jgi:hypothetical protein
MLAVKAPVAASLPEARSYHVRDDWSRIAAPAASPPSKHGGTPRPRAVTRAGSSVTLAVRPSGACAVDRDARGTFPSPNPCAEEEFTLDIPERSAVSAPVDFLRHQA